MSFQKKEISIPMIMEVGPGRLSNIGASILKSGIMNIAVFFGTGIKDLFGSEITESFKNAPELHVLEEFECDQNTMEEVLLHAYSLPIHVQGIVGIGGGKVLDVAKYIAFLNNLPFISVPTSPAHDGFASSGCSLYINGRRSSVSARSPYGIIVDTGVIKNSPAKFLYSGIGDIISKVTAVFDWQYEERLGNTLANGMAIMIAKKSVNSIARMPFKSITEDFFIKELVDSLTMSGLAMEIAGNSAPASGSEHLISHALDKNTPEPQLHGIQVGIATYIMSMVQNHRVERVRKFLTDTGFFSYAATLNLNILDYEKAIDLAPSIKPDRRLYIHEEKHRAAAKKLLREDEVLRDIFK